MLDSVSRFSSRVGDYVRWRPSYPPAAASLLARECGLGPDSIVADIGSGTGFFTRLLLDSGASVFAVEPNPAMRAAAEESLASEPRFHSVAGAAEQTTLAPASCSLVTAAQAFHWFDRARARAEFQRILRPSGWIVLAWNERRTSGSPFLEAYEDLLLRWCPEYPRVAATYPSAAALEPFFAPALMRSAAFPNSQSLDFEGLRGRLLSSSYAPRPPHPNHEPMLAALDRIFHSHQSAGQVEMTYDCLLYYAPVS